MIKRMLGKLDKQLCLGFLCPKCGSCLEYKWNGYKDAPACPKGCK